MNQDLKITGDFYAKSAAEFKAIKALALTLGYKGQEMKSHPEDEVLGTGQYLTMQEPYLIRKGKCGFCNSLIEIRGVYGHGRKCEVCGETICVKYKKNDLITFFFRNSGSMHDITLRVYEYNDQDSIIHFYTQIPLQGRHGNQKIKQVKKVLQENKNSYTFYENRKGKRFYSFYYSGGGMLNEQCKINVCDSRDPERGESGGFKKCSVVKIMNGVEYSEWDSFAGMSPKLPLPESFHIYRDWKVEKSIYELCHRAGISSRPEYYSGRGENGGDLNDKHLTKLYKLIKDFKGEEAAKEFVTMVENTKELSATAFIRRLLILDQNDYKWDSKYDVTQTENDDVEIDPDNILSTVATMASLMSGRRGRMKDVFNVFGYVNHSFTDNMKQMFLNSIK